MPRKRLRSEPPPPAEAPAQRRRAPEAEGPPRRAPEWPWLLLLGALCALFMGFTHGYDGVELQKGYDWAENYGFQRDFLGEALEKGEFPLWCPYTFGGRPFAADPQTACFYPVTLAWLVLPKITALTLDVLFHYVLASAFAFLFLRALAVRPAFAAFGGLLFALSGFNLHHTAAGHPHFHAAVAWLPLVFWCVERACGGRRAFWLWGGAALGVQFLAGSIPVSWMTFLFAGVYGAVRSAWPYETRRLLHGLVGIAAMLALGAGLAAVQILPTSEFAAHSVRSASSYEYSTYQDLPPRNLVNLLFPQGKIDRPGVPEERKLLPEGEFNGYVGIAALGLGLAGFLLLPRRPTLAGLVACAGGALILMLGDATPLFRLAWWIVPGVSALRFHCREILVLSFCLTAASAVALEEFAGAPSRATGRGRPPRAPDGALDRAAWIAGGALLVGAIAGALLLAGNPTAPPWQYAFLVAGLAAPWAARRWAARAALGTSLLALGFLDVTVNSAHFDRFFAQVRMGRPAAEEEISRTIRGDGGLFRGHFYKRAYTRQRFIADRFSGVDGYEAMIPRRWYALIHDLSGVPIKQELVAEATQELLNRRPSLFPFRVLNVKYTTVKVAEGPYRLVVNPDPDPRAWLAAEALVVPDDAEATALLKSPAFDPRRTAILDSEPPAEVPRAPASGAAADGGAPVARSLSPDGRVSTTEAGRCELVEWNLNSQRVRVTAERPAILVVSEGWFPGWTVTVDGRRAPLHRAHVALRGVAVPAGSHEVVFRYRPRSVAAGAVVSLLSACVLAAGIVFLWRSERGARSPADR